MINIVVDDISMKNKYEPSFHQRYSNYKNHVRAINLQTKILYVHPLQEKSQDLSIKA